MPTLLSRSGECSEADQVAARSASCATACSESFSQARPRPNAAQATTWRSSSERPRSRAGLAVASAIRASACIARRRTSTSRLMRSLMVMARASRTASANASATSRGESLTVGVALLSTLGFLRHALTTNSSMTSATVVQWRKHRSPWGECRNRFSRTSGASTVPALNMRFLGALTSRKFEQPRCPAPRVLPE